MRSRSWFMMLVALGTYTAVCLIKEGSRTHADLGMKMTFTVT